MKDTFEQKLISSLAYALADIKNYCNSCLGISQRLTEQDIIQIHTDKIRKECEYETNNTI